MRIWKAFVLLSATGILLLACAAPEVAPATSPTLEARPGTDQSYDPTPEPHPINTGSKATAKKEKPIFEKYGLFCA